MPNNNEIQPRLEIAQKMTRTRLLSLLEELQLKYTLDGEGANFKIIIDLPEEHIEEKKKLKSAAVLSEAYETKFDKENFMPLWKKIKHSTNFDCRLEIADDQYIISVLKK